MDLHETLCKIVAEKNWLNLVDVVTPKYFYPAQKKTLAVKRNLAKFAEILTTPDANLPVDIRILILKGLANSCVEGYKHKEYLTGYDTAYKLYAALSECSVDTDEHARYFPYAGILEWTVDCIQNGGDHPQEQCEILQFCVQFLVNFTVLACDIADSPSCLKSSRFKAALISLVKSSHPPLARAACLYIWNQLTRSTLPQGYYTEAELCSLAQPLIQAAELEVDIAVDVLIFLLKIPSWLRNAYDNLSIKYILELLDIIHEDVRKTVYSGTTSEASTNFPREVVQFLSERFRKKSDLILKTVDSYLDGLEPAEVTLLLDIIGVISSKGSAECDELQSDKSLMINCIFLLKSLHMTGKTSENYFTPLQKLSDVSPNSQGPCNTEIDKDFERHPAFGFKAGLIRVIGNLAHRHKINQELLRETDTLPLLLDCCNIDARNPLIMQWTIFALRNVCENSLENQEIIHQCNKLGVIDNAVLREMGLKLHENDDGKSIGILPLPRSE